jgi:hypothetical protein
MSKNKILYALTCIYFVAVIVISNFFLLERGISNINGFNDCFQTVIERFELTQSEAQNLRTKPYFTTCHNSAYGDEIEYIAIAAGLNAYEPYSLRPLIPKIIGSLVSLSVTYEKDKTSFFRNIFIVNQFLTVLFLLIGLIAIYYAVSRLTNISYLKLVLPSIFLINIGVYQTASFLMLDIASYSVAAICIYFTSNKNYFGLSLSIILGILIKEVLIIYSLCFILLFYQHRRFSLHQVLLSIFPIIFFVGFRIFSDVDPLSMQYGWDISKGEIKLHYMNGHLSYYAIPFLIKLFSVLGFPLIIFLSYHKNFKQNKFYICMFILMLASIILANLLLASRVPRVVFVVYPFLAFIIAKVASDEGVHQIRNV